MAIHASRRILALSILSFCTASAQVPDAPAPGGAAQPAAAPTGRRAHVVAGCENPCAAAVYSVGRRRGNLAPLENESAALEGAARNLKWNSGGENAQKAKTNPPHPREKPAGTNNIKPGTGSSNINP